MKAIRHLIVAVLAGTTLTAAPAQGPEPGSATFTITARGQRIGQETVRLTRTADGWLISASGSQGGASIFTIDKFEAAYSADWQPRSLVIEAQSGSQPVKVMTLTTTFTETTATSDAMEGGVKSAPIHKVSPRTVVLPNNFFGAYEALAARLAGATVGTTFPVYVAPSAEITGTVTAVTAQRIQTPEAIVDLRHFSLSMKNPAGIVVVDVAVDNKNRLARVAVPAAGVVVLRNDLASVMSRDVTYQNDADKAVFIPGLGFTIAATITAPAVTNPAEKLPAVVLISGAPSTDRDETLFGIPVYGQLSAALAKAGFFVVRYDKRGIGQSGGRLESSTIQDYAEDAVSVVNWLRDRKDIDRNRIAVVGRAEGAAVALLSGDRAGGKVSALVLMAAPGLTGREIVLAQQQRVLDASTEPIAEKQAKIALQTRILDAVAKGSGWDGVPMALQRAADTLMFKSWVEFDPAAAMKRADQPILVVHGALDTEMPPTYADKLEALARARKTKAAPLTRKVVLPGVNHLLADATTGEATEYASLPTKSISPAVATSIVEWLRVVMPKK